MKLGTLPRFNYFIFLIFGFVFLIIFFLGVYYWQTTKKSTVTEITPLPTGELMEAASNIDVFLAPGERKVGYFVPGQKFSLTGEEVENWIQVIDSDNYELWIGKDAHYEPVKE